MSSTTPVVIPSEQEPIGDDTLKKRTVNFEEEKENKKQKLYSEISEHDETITNLNSNDQEPPTTKKQHEKIQRIHQKELEKAEREKKKEEEKARKEMERKKKEDERQRKFAEKEMEKELRRKKIEEEKKERDRKKEDEKKIKEQKREAERIEREQKKEQERIRKQNEKEEREKLRLEKKRKLEEEKEKKEEEKRKLEEQKNKNQMKISSFFSIGNKKTDPKNNISKSIDSSGEPENVNAYNKVFLPFYVKKNMQMAGSFVLEKEGLNKSKAEFDIFIKSGPIQTSDLRNFFLTKTKMEPKKPYTSPQEVLHALNSSDVTESKIYNMIQNIPPVKYLQFYENSKPPYIGTWCSEKHQSVHIPVSDPFNTSITGLDYSYDSDLEWNGEEEEGEDLDNDDDEEEEEDMEEEDELDDFVEGNSESKKRRKFIGPLVSFTKWNDGTDNAFFDEVKYEIIDVKLEFPIDPNDVTLKNKSETVTASSITDTATTATSKIKSPGAEQVTNTLVPKKKAIEDEKVIIDLIKFIEKNNDFTIGTLVELSQKEFKNFTKAMLKHTIQNIASYNKKTSTWEVDSDTKEKYKQI